MKVFILRERCALDLLHTSELSNDVYNFALAQKTYKLISCYLNHHFHLHVCVSLCPFVRSSVTLQRYITLIAPVAPESQNVINKSC